MKLKAVMLPFDRTIFQNIEGQPVSSDSGFFVQYVLDNYQNPEAEVLEIGSGIGIIAIMLGHYRSRYNISGIEIQSHLVELSNKNAANCELLNVKFLNCDLREFHSRKKYDLIISNPPYYTTTSGRIPPNEERAISRFEIKCNMLDVFNVIKSCLAKDGYSYLIYPYERYDEILKNAKITKMDILKHDIYGEKINKKIIVEVRHAGS